MSADHDLNKQFAQIENFISSDARIIMLNAVDPVAIAPAADKARAAGIVAAGFDAAARGADLTVMTDNVRAGAQACQHIVDHLRNATADQDALASREGGLAKSSELLTRFPKLDAVFAIGDPTAIGMDLAARQLHRREFIITAVDGSPDVVAAMRGDQSLIRVSAAQDPYGMASDAFRLAVGILNGHRLASPVVLLPPTLITPGDLATYRPWNTAPHPVTAASNG